MVKKEFNKKFMHPTRKKLVDMVLTGGEYDKNTSISFANAEKALQQKREVGERWTDENGQLWEQKEFGRIKISELTDTMSDVRAYLQKLNSCKAEDCNTIKVGPTDKKLISKTGYCSRCLAKKEFIIKNDGMWEAYEEYKIYSNMIGYGKDVISKFKQAYEDTKQEYEIVKEDGTLEKWVMERDAEQLKAEILSDIENFEKEIEQAKELRNQAWDKLKDKNYDLVTAPTD